MRTVMILISCAALAGCQRTVQPVRVTFTPESTISSAQRDQLCSVMWQVLDANGETNSAMDRMLPLTPPSPERSASEAASRRADVAHDDSVEAMTSVCPR